MTDRESGTRLVVLADRQGRIIAGHLVGGVRSTGTALGVPQATLAAGEGQVVREVDVPRGLMEEGKPRFELLDQYRLELDKEARLVRQERKSS